MEERRVKAVTLYMDHCTQCIRAGGELSSDGNYHMYCHGKQLEPRVFTEAEIEAIRNGEMRIPDWCPLPDSVEVER